MYIVVFMGRNIGKLSNNIIARDFKTFLIKAFYTVNCGYEFIDNWHIDLLCDALSYVAKGKVKRLIINIPPRSLKSVIGSVAFPAWIIGRKPSARVVVASYSRELALKHSFDSRLIMQSEWYRDTFPKSAIVSGLNTKHKFGTNYNGYRFATSIGSSLTGEGGDILIIDDPHNPIEIHTSRARKSVIQWYQNVFLSRLNNKKNGSVIIIMQRLHVEDLTGFLMQSDGYENWQHISLPLLAKEDCNITFNNKLYISRKFGGILYPNFEINDVEVIKKDVGYDTFLAQYQQAPVAISGNLIKSKWINIQKSSDFSICAKYISVDCANGIRMNNDYSAIGVFGKHENGVILLAMHRVKMEYLDLKALIIQLVKKYDPETVLIENKANGVSILQDIGKDFSSFVGVTPTSSKEMRVNRILSFFEAGKLIIAEGSSWNNDLITELLDFPLGKHDDQIDCISQFVNWYVERELDMSKVKFKLRNISL